MPPAGAGVGLRLRRRANNARQRSRAPANGRRVSPLRAEIPHAGFALASAPVGPLPNPSPASRGGAFLVRGADGELASAGAPPPGSLEARHPPPILGEGFLTLDLRHVILPLPLAGEGVGGRGGRGPAGYPTSTPPFSPFPPLAGERGPGGEGAHPRGRQRDPRVRAFGPKGRDPAAVCGGSTPLSSVVCCFTEPKPDPGARRGHAQTVRTRPFQPDPTITPFTGGSSPCRARPARSA